MDTLNRPTHEADQLKRKLAALRQAMLELEQNFFDLDREISCEEQRTSAFDPTDCKYSELAKHQRQRRKNLAFTLQIFKAQESAEVQRLEALGAETPWRAA